MRSLLTEVHKAPPTGFQELEEALSSVPERLRDAQQPQRFWRDRIDTESACELVQRYQDRFRRNERRLFTFLDHDGVPWNNNNAENAIKAFAALRRGAEGLFT
ncbi:MAG: IS66 family transposase, partial [Polyangiaceae bacterium]